MTWTVLPRIRPIPASLIVHSPLGRESYQVALEAKDPFRVLGVEGRGLVAGMAEATETSREARHVLKLRLGIEDAKVGARDVVIKTDDVHQPEVVVSVLVLPPEGS